MMDDFKKIKKDLDLILKKGDLYDVILKKENKNISKHSMIGSNILFFSRLLYLVSLIGKKVKGRMASITEIKKANDNIRKALGMPVDILNTYKETFTNIIMCNHTEAEDVLGYYKHLVIKYENEGIGCNQYIDNLKKIHHFCELYEIKSVLLKKEDIFSLLQDSSVNQYPCISLSDILLLSDIKKPYETKEILNANGIFYDINKEINCQYLALDLLDLQDIIKKLDIVKFDIQVFLSFQKSIQDTVVKNAITTFLKMGNLKKLKQTVNQRLTLFINSNNTFKVKNYGKAIQNIKIIEEKVQVFIQDANGTPIENKVISLYDYLEVRDYKSLLKQVERENEDKELFYLASLYSYLIEKGKCNIFDINQKKNITLYDYYYQVYQLKKQKKIKKIPGLYSKSNTIAFGFCSYIYSFYFMLIIVGILYITEWITEKTRTYIFKQEEPSLYEKTLDNIEDIYKESWKLEKDLFHNGIEFCKDCLSIDFGLEEKSADFNFSWNDFNNGRTGDAEDLSERREKSKTEIATVTLLDDKAVLPSYFATSVAFDSHYYNGEKYYEMTRNTVLDLAYDDVSPIFCIQYTANKNDIYWATYYGNMDFLQTFYPVGENYVVINFSIYDKSNTSKEIIWNKKREESNELLTKEEKNILDSMEDPEICLSYGISEEVESAFLSRLKYNGRNFSSEERKEAIKKGLGVKQNATLEEIYAAIQNKQYSKTPIKDAGLTKKIMNMTEQEYFETIASLDSLICNLAATLAVGIEDNLVYTTGFLNVNDEFLTVDEAHAWGMRLNGEIVDVTPSTISEKDKKIQEVAKTILDWGLENNIPIYSLMVLIGITIKKMFGEKILFQYHFIKSKNLITKEDIEKTYANLNKFIYGNMTYPSKRTPTQFVNTIANEFSGYSEDELKKLKQELLQNKRFHNKYLKSTLQLMKEIPFIIENEDELKRALKKEG